MINIIYPFLTFRFTHLIGSRKIECDSVLPTVGPFIPLNTLEVGRALGVAQLTPDCSKMSSLVFDVDCNVGLCLSNGC